MPALPYQMFDVARSASEARRFEKVENIYHKGQDLAWDGREVLDSLVKKHGGVHVPEDKREALASVFGPILWGELAAWKISAQLADRLDPLEAKMAATSQAHDEARHFYVMHDYLTLALGDFPRKIHHASERLLGAVLATDDLAQKLFGMQLQVETTALTIFQATREARICPVLSDLMLYYEKDEARHVGLGTQVLPMLMRRMSRLEGARLSAFALKVTYWMIASNLAMDKHLRALGVDPRRVVQLAKSKQMIVFDDLNRSIHKTNMDAGDVVARLMEAVTNTLWPPADQTDVMGRARAFMSGLWGGVEQVETQITPPG